MRKLFSIFFLLVSLTASSQKFSASISRSTIGVGERVQITYTLENGNGKRFTQPTFDGLQLLGGPNTSTSMQWVNGRSSSSESYSFILVATQEGDFTINPATIEVNGKPMKSEAISFKVVQGQPRAQKQQNQNQRQQQTNAASNDDLESNLFMKLYVDKKNAFVGEQIIAIYKLFINAQVINYANNRPVYNGFYAQDIEVDPNTDMTTETINGKQFRVATMKKVVLTPQTSGELEIPALEMEMAVKVQDQNRGRSMFDQMFGSFQNVKVQVNSNPEKVTISALPRNNQPGDFNGAVGNFTLKVKTDKTEIGVNEAINLTVSLEGRGNIELMSVPKVEFPKDFETYEPKVKQNVVSNGSGTSGEKSFEYVVIPRYAGDFELKPISLSYFDPASGTYKRLTSDPITIKVNKGSGASDGSDMAFVTPKKEDIQMLGKDIRYIKPATSDLTQSNDRLFGTLPFYGLASLPLAGMGLAIFLIQGARRRGSDISLMKSKRARSLAKKRFSKAKNLITGNDDALYYEEIFKGLYGYLSDKFQIPLSDLNKDTIDLNLSQRNISETLKLDLRKVLDECELARFAPGVIRGKEAMLSSSIEIVEKLENEA